MTYKKFPYMDHQRLQGICQREREREREREFDAKLPFPLEVCVGFDC
jgi:hypothetical protein